MDRRTDGRSSPHTLDMHDALGSADTPPDWRERARTVWRRPLARVLAGVAAIGLLALLYLNQVAGVALANDQLSALNAQRSRLQRQDSQLHAQLGTDTSPAYVDRRARAMGLTPAPFGSAVYIAVSHGLVPANGQAGAGGQP